MMKKNRSETEKLLSMTDDNIKITPNYFDDDLVIIDNIQLLDIPNMVKPNMNIIGICTRGRLHTMLNGEPFEVHERQVFICPPETSLRETMVSPDFEYAALCITNRALQLYLHHFIQIWNDFAYVQKMRIIDPSEDDMLFYEKAYDLISLTLNQPIDESDRPFREEVIKGLVGALLNGFCSLLQKHTEGRGGEASQTTKLFNQFLTNLQSVTRKHQPVAHYASQLCISAKYLTVICKKNSGKTANDWVTEYTLADISHYLRDTTMSIKEVSNLLGFTNTSFFGKYVKDHLGCTPVEYRSQKNKTV